ncbi:MAG: TRAP transporter permease [Chloroflexota bacterium]
MIANEESDLHRSVHGAWYGVVVVGAITGILLALNNTFQPFELNLGGLSIPLTVLIWEFTYLYILVGLFTAMGFLMFPARVKDAEKVQWYDVLLAITALGVSGYFAINAPYMSANGWEFRSPLPATIAGGILVLLILESVRRTNGLSFAIIVALCASYPLVAGILPGPIKGVGVSFENTIRYHAFSPQSIMGQTTQVVGGLLIGFSIFGMALFMTGAGTFFTNITMGLLGHVRGGSAKVAIVASGLYGMLSGSGVSNVLSTGTITIPAMKRTGFTPEVAAAVEANAASHGAMTPPVMGATAFLMAIFLGIPYSVVAIGAAIPAFLFYYSMFVQIDSYAAKRGMQGMDRSELPKLGPTLRQGWPYIFALALLVLLLVFMKREAQAPWITTAVLIAITQIRRETRWTRARALDFFASAGRLLAGLVPLLAAVGMLVGSLFVTGTAASITSDLVHLSQGNLFAMLVMGAVISFVLGTGLPGSAAYIFLGIMLAPALVKQGLNPLAVHMFLLYWANLADVTPPTAISVVAAAGVAGSSVMTTMWEAMKMAVVKYLLPFFFVLSPALVLQDTDPMTFLVLFTEATLGITVIAYAMQGYMPWVGTLSDSLPARVGQIVLVVGSMAMAVPDGLVLMVSTVIVLSVYALFVVANKRHWSILVAKSPGQGLIDAPRLQTVT